MIYNDNFIWLHFPKCAGTKVEHLFQQYLAEVPGIVMDAVGVQYDPSISWHDSILDRQRKDADFVSKGKTIICSFRRLPRWLESRYKFEVARNPDLNHRPELLLEGKFLEANGFQNNADYYAEKYLPPDLFAESTVEFLRTEHFQRDFKVLFGRFLDLSAIPSVEFEAKTNSSPGLLPDNVLSQLRSADAPVYQHCPYWTKIEKMAYGRGA